MKKIYKRNNINSKRLMNILSICTKFKLFYKNENKRTNQKTKIFPRVVKNIYSLSKKKKTQH